MRQGSSIGGTGRGRGRVAPTRQGCAEGSNNCYPFGTTRRDHDRFNRTKAATANHSKASLKTFGVPFR